MVKYKYTRLIFNSIRHKNIYKISYNFWHLGDMVPLAP